MHWLQTIDVGLLRFINETLSNSVFDVVMPFASGNRFFFPALAVIGMLLLWKGGKRGWLCAMMCALILWPGDSFICSTIKHAVARPRPFVTLVDIRTPATTIKSRFAHVPRMEHWQSDFGSPAGEPNHNSMPSSHAANWFAATMICYVFYRRSWRFMLPLACLVSFSRVYNGVHYPTDVLAGAILGAGYAAAGMWLIESLWKWIGQRWFPLWWEKLPSLVNVRPTAEPAEPEMLPPTDDASPATRQTSLDQHWLRLGYIFLAITLLGRLAYLASGTIQLTEDEAYQWTWSKHLALSYYSKPLLIACTQWLGTHIWGDTQFGVRFFAPVIGTVLGFLLLRFFARTVNARAGFFLLLIISATPLMALGSILMTVDPLSVLFWTAAMIAGWDAIQTDSKTTSWLWVGLWTGLGFLSKYTELLQLLSWAVFFAVWKPARVQLRKPGPYLALLLTLLCSIPVLVWNQQHSWITVAHVEGNAGLGDKINPQVFQFLGSEAALLNPIFFVAMLWAAVMFWHRARHDPRLVFLFSMGAPLFLCYFIWSFHSSIKPNWIAPSVLPLICLAVAYWDTRFRLGVRAVKLWLFAGLAIGFAFVAVLHDTNIVGKIAGKPLPPKPDPLTRARGYDTMAEMVNDARVKLATDGKPAFIIANHYGLTGELSFYLPEAKTNVVGTPLVYAMTTDKPVNQYFFWPSYSYPETRKGENAIFVQELSMPRLIGGWEPKYFPLIPIWIPKWLHGTNETDLWREQPKPRATPPPKLVEQFESVQDLGVFYVSYRGRIFHIIQMYECRNLR